MQCSEVEYQWDLYEFETSEVNSNSFEVISKRYHILFRISKDNKEM